MMQEETDRGRLAEYIVEHLDQAIREKQIQVYLQPIYRTISRQLCGFEALARWDDPKQGFLCPGDFIPVLEDTQRIYQLDIFVLQEVCRMQRARMELGLPVVPISMNLSRTDFLKCDMVDVAQKAIEQYDVPRELLRMEITESALLQDTEAILAVVERFRQKGFRVWMDDFGAGYSALSMLAACDFDTVKLDIGFLRHFHDKTRKVIENIVRMVKQLGMQTLVEGVETEEQYQFLLQIGCELVQGFYLGKPASVAATRTLLEERRQDIEEREESDYYDCIGAVEYVTRRPLILYEMLDEHIRMLYHNIPFDREMEESPLRTAEEMIRVFNEDTTALSMHFRAFLDSIEEFRVVYQFDFTTAGNGYIRLLIQKIAEHGHRKAFKMEVASLTSHRGAYHALSQQPDGAYYEFTDDCRVGVGEIDLEHLYFFDLCNAAVATVKEASGVNENAKRIIREIKAYAHTHFAHEEAYMESIQDPLLARQRVEHQQFIEKADGIDVESMTESEYVDTVNFIVQWLYKHIIGSDTKIGNGRKS